jgi:hypothetical protein
VRAFFASCDCCTTRSFNAKLTIATFVLPSGVQPTEGGILKAMGVTGLPLLAHPGDAHLASGFVDTLLIEAHGIMHVAGEHLALSFTFLLSSFVVTSQAGHHCVFLTLAWVLQLLLAGEAFLPCRVFTFATLVLAMAVKSAELGQVGDVVLGITGIPLLAHLGDVNLSCGLVDGLLMQTHWITHMTKSEFTISFAVLLRRCGMAGPALQRASSILA